MSAALSDLIGGGLLDEALHATFDGHRYVVYLDEQRVELDLPVNDRAVVLSARLGVVDRTWMRDLRGDALILGADEHRNDDNVPRAVLDLARAAGVLPSLEPRFLPPGYHGALGDPRRGAAATSAFAVIRRLAVAPQFGSIGRRVHRPQGRASVPEGREGSV